ncbi:YidB family protein [Pseudoroseomonas globiformis]|uniref:YidB family protein n=1 Tax=Teichococcus globiformis TaxID=2307229 RepID=A0ABV7FZI5_9PROT
MSEFFGGQRGGGLGGGLSNGVKMAAIALLVQQLMKHARSQQDQPSGMGHGGTPGPAGLPGGASSGGQGGIGDVLGGLLRGDSRQHQPEAPGQGGQGLPPYQVPGQQGDQRTGGSASPGGGLADVLGGLLGGGGQPGAGGAGMGGGLGGVLGSILGGGMGGAAGGRGMGGSGSGANAGLGGLLGGLAGMLGGMRRQGFAEEVDSWVSPGANREIPLSALEREFDPAELDQVAVQLGTDRQSLLEELRRTMPELVDRMTPQGQVPEREDELGQGGVGELLGSLLRPREPGGPGSTPRA